MSLPVRAPDRWNDPETRRCLEDEGHRYNDDERTQRSRGFVHCVVDSAVSLAAGSDALKCYENGVGALNLPLTHAQLGTQSFRSAHPVALEEIAALVRRVTDRTLRIELPNMFETKAAICRGVGHDLADLVSESVSCDSFPLRVRGTAQCGHCTSCILRRQALKVAGLQKHDSGRGYRHDLHNVHGWHGDDVTFELSVMLDQARRIGRTLAQRDPWYALSLELPTLEQTVLELARWGWNETETRAAILRLYEDYCSDWDHFAQRSFGFAA